MKSRYEEMCKNVNLLENSKQETVNNNDNSNNKYIDTYNDVAGD